VRLSKVWQGAEVPTGGLGAQTHGCLCRKLQQRLKS